jgi:repressor LexA
MRKRDDSKKLAILEYIDEYYSDYGQIPTVRAISEGTGIAVATVHRYLLALKDLGELDYNGRRSITTERIDREAIHYAAPVLGYVACGEGQEEVEEVIEYVRLPESLVGKGEFFVLIAKGESMINAGIRHGDYVVIRKQSTANIGDYVVALYNGLNNLKKLAYKDGKYLLRSCNDDKDSYPDIHVNNLQVQGVAVCVMHSLIKK